MASGGIHDQVGGGFHRYATDARWLVPHFEKMLYDNALRAVEYIEGWQATGREDFATVARSTLDYVLREMRSPSGGFYSATECRQPGPRRRVTRGLVLHVDGRGGRRCAAPGGGEGREGLLRGDGGPGTSRARTVLHAWRERSEVARALGATGPQLDAWLASARAGLYDRAARAPGTAPRREGAGGMERSE